MFNKNAIYALGSLLNVCVILHSEYIHVALCFHETLTVSCVPYSDLLFSQWIILESFSDLVWFKIVQSFSTLNILRFLDFCTPPRKHTYLSVESKYIKCRHLPLLWKTISNIFAFFLTIQTKPVTSSSFMFFCAFYALSIWDNVLFLNIRLAITLEKN